MEVMIQGMLNFYFLVCSRRNHEFFYNSSDFYQIKVDSVGDWTLPGTNPFHLASIVCFCSSIVVTPVCYAVIYK